MDVTAPRSSAYHRAVRYWTEQMLTKRRAVDFCRLAASLCRMV
ncbi:Ms5788A family Cys-rich leader peptide [Actinomadura flavalba]